MGRSHGLGAPRHGIVFLQPAQRNVGTDLRAPGDWNTVSIARSISEISTWAGVAPSDVQRRYAPAILPGEDAPPRAGRGVITMDRSA